MENNIILNLGKENFYTCHGENSLSIRIHVNNSKHSNHANKILLNIIILPNSIKPPEIYEISLRQGKNKIKSCISS